MLKASEDKVIICIVGTHDDVDMVALAIYKRFSSNETNALNIMRSDLEEKIKIPIWNRTLVYAAANGNVKMLEELYHDIAQTSSITSAAKGINNAIVSAAFNDQLESFQRLFHLEQIHVQFVVVA